MLELIIANLEKVGIGAGIFLLAYMSNIMLGAWRNTKIDAQQFDWKKIANSVVQYLVLGASISFLTIVVTVIPSYVALKGFQIDAETMKLLDASVILGAFIAAALRYVKDAFTKIKDLLA